MTNLDPAGLRTHGRAIVLVAALAIAATLIGFASRSVPVWPMVPAILAIVWRAEGRQWRDIALWAVLVSALEVAAGYVAGPTGVALRLAGLAFVAVAILGPRPDVPWLVALRLVQDRPAPHSKHADLLNRIDHDVSGTLAHYKRDSDAKRLHSELSAALSRAARLIADGDAPSWVHAYINWLSMITEMSRDPISQPDDAYEDLDRRRAEFVAARDDALGAS